MASSRMTSHSGSSFSLVDFFEEAIAQVLVVVSAELGDGCFKLKSASDEQLNPKWTKIVK